MISLLYTLVVVGYLTLGAFAWRQTVRVPVAGVGELAVASHGVPSEPRSSSIRMPERSVLAIVWILHLWLILDDILAPEGPRFGFALSLSATLWLAVAVYWVESFYFALASMRLLILPLAGLCALLPWWFPGTPALISVALGGSNAPSPAFEAHLAVALLGYGILTIAALHALLMALLERWLHRSELTRETGMWSRVESAILGQLPPLMTMERLLFRLVGVGFVLLTLTVVTGIVFTEALFGRPMVFSHKSLFTIIAWIIFAALLAGRAFYGWRGRVALRWTLAGFLAMLLAYAGSRFVLEVILHRV